MPDKPREPSDLLEIVVIVTEPFCDRLEDVAAGLREAGMRVDEVLEGIGMIQGAVAAEQEKSLQSVPGVQEVERSRPYEL